MTMLWFSHPACREHRPAAGHPESPARLDAIEHALAPLGLERRAAPAADEAALLRCHPADYLALLRAPVAPGRLRALDPDTALGPGSWQAALHAAGGAVAAVDAVLGGEARAAYVGCRPPGHHAEAARAMGFCLLNNVAIAARHALIHHGLRRVAVIDFDVHHGNGTQALLWDEPGAFYLSSHQMPLFPGTGAREERGAHDNVLNLPLAAGSNGAAMRRLYEREGLPALDAFRPELVLVSAGFDAHRADPLAGLEWEAGDFAWLADRICDLAADHAAGRVVSVQEGGYDLPALGASVAAFVGRVQARTG